jgi:hypothetical protein
MQYGDLIDQLFYKLERWRRGEEEILRLFLEKILVRVADDSDSVRVVSMEGFRY